MQALGIACTAMIAGFQIPCSQENYDVPGVNVEEEFVSFRRKYNKQYSSRTELIARKAIFTFNLQYIHKQREEQQNSGAGPDDAILGVTNFADMTEEELRSRASKLEYDDEMRDAPRMGAQDLIDLHASIKGEPNLGTGDAILSNSDSNDDRVGTTVEWKMPRMIDWVRRGGVTRVGEQGECGSCWAWVAAGVLETQQFLLTGKLQTLSTQHLIDCVRDGKDGCRAGNPIRAFNYLYYQGLPSEKDAPYLCSDSNNPECKKKTCDETVPATLEKGAVRLPLYLERNGNALQHALLFGTVSAHVYAFHKNFMHYRGGVIRHSNCMVSSDTPGDHGVLVVGFGSTDGLDYWKVKNSYGKDWGEFGFARLERGFTMNTCGIFKNMVFAIMKRPIQSAYLDETGIPGDMITRTAKGIPILNILNNMNKKNSIHSTQYHYNNLPDGSGQNPEWNGPTDGLRNSFYPPGYTPIPILDPRRTVPSNLHSELAPTDPPRNGSHYDIPQNGSTSNGGKSNVRGTPAPYWAPPAYIPQNGSTNNGGQSNGRGAPPPHRAPPPYIPQNGNSDRQDNRGVKDGLYTYSPDYRPGDDGRSSFGTGSHRQHGFQEVTPRAEAPRQRGRRKGNFRKSRTPILGGANLPDQVLHGSQNYFPPPKGKDEKDDTEWSLHHVPHQQVPPPHVPQIGNNGHQPQSNGLGLQNNGPDDYTPRNGSNDHRQTNGQQPQQQRYNPAPFAHPRSPPRDQYPSPPNGLYPVLPRSDSELNLRPAPTQWLSSSENGTKDSSYWSSPPIDSTILSQKYERRSISPEEGNNGWPGDRGNPHRRDDYRPIFDPNRFTPAEDSERQRGRHAGNFRQKSAPKLAAADPFYTEDPYYSHYYTNQEANHQSMQSSSSYQYPQENTHDRVEEERRPAESHTSTSRDRTREAPSILV